MKNLQAVIVTVAVVTALFAGYRHGYSAGANASMTYQEYLNARDLIKAPVAHDDIGTDSFFEATRLPVAYWQGWDAHASTF